MNDMSKKLTMEKGFIWWLNHPRETGSGIAIFLLILAGVIAGASLL